MPRFNDPFTQYQDNEGNLLSGGKLIFYVAGTVNEYLQTYRDNEEQVSHPLDGVPLDANGRVPPIFYKGSADVELRDASGQLVDSKDSVGGENVFGDFTAFSLVIVYDKNDKVLANNGKFYLSLQNENVGNDPTLNPGNNEFWTEIRFIEIFNLKNTYQLGEIVQTTNGELWRSSGADNTGNEPVDGSTHWEPVYDVVHDPKYGRILSRTSGQSLHHGKVNSLEDASTFPLPAANSVSANTWLKIIQQSTFANSNQPIVQRAGSDLIEVNGTTDTAVQFDRGVFTEITLTSNGVDRWKI